MDVIVIGLIVGAASGSSYYILYSNHFTKAQKTFLLICIFFPPAQWILAIIIYFFNTTYAPKQDSFTKPSESTSQQKQTKHRNSSTSDQKQSLQALKDKDILSETEYQAKLEMIIKKEKEIQENHLLDELKETSNYQKLFQLFKDEILTKDEFDSKLLVIKQKFKEKRELDERVVELSENKLTSKWTDGRILFKFIENYNFDYYSNINKPSYPVRGSWRILNVNTIVLKIGKNQETLDVLFFTEGKFYYRHKASIFKLNKIMD